MRAQIRATLRRWRRSFDRRGYISFGPGAPVVPVNAISKICAALGWRVEAHPAATTLVMFWPTSEHSAPPQPSGWINGRCLNIDKTRVAEAFEAGFGRSYTVEAATYDGQFVRKSETNARHDGRVLFGPAALEPGCFDMRLLNNRREDEVEDIRIIFMRGVLPFVYLKRRPIASRFSNANSRVQRVATSAVIDAAEAEQIASMCSNIGLEYGELDAIRDATDGLLYVIDVNRTPVGPPNGLTAAEGRRAIAEMASQFRSTFLPSQTA